MLFLATGKTCNASAFERSTDNPGPRRRIESEFSKEIHRILQTVCL